MPRPSREIVDEIRARRGKVLADVRDLTPVRELERRVRQAPGLWLAGGILAGLVSGRFLAAPLFRSSRGRVGDYVRSRFKQGAVALAVAALGRLGGQRDGAEPAASAPEPASRPAPR
jgi:hypothetical protein